MEFRGYLVDYGESVGDSSVPSDSDRKFLIDFIYTTYLGPDIKHYNTGCSVRERVIGGSPPYSLSDLAPSFLPIAFLEGMYYHVLRYSSRELVLDPHMLRMYLQGKLFLPSSDFTPDSPQFTSFFPLDLHEQKWDPNLFRIVRGLVFIDDPATAYIEEEDLNRFKSLTRVTTLKLNSSDWADYEDDDYSVNIEPENSQNEEGESGKFQQRHKGKNVDDTLPMPEFRSMFPTKHNVKLHPSKNTCKSDGPTYMPLLSVPDIGFWSQNCSTVFKGSARNGILCPPLGTVDIGIGEAAYVFRVSLVGVHKHLGKVTCNVQSNGRVTIKGVVTHGRTITRGSPKTRQLLLYEMKIRKSCPPGPFTVSFNLPGPVDPRLFGVNFAWGLLEGIAIKK